MAYGRHCPWYSNIVLAAVTNMLIVSCWGAAINQTTISTTAATKLTTTIADVGGAASTSNNTAVSRKHFQGYAFFCI